MTLIYLIIYNQGVNIWNKCYHSSRYPITTFENLDNVLDQSTSGSDFTAEPNANSTQINLENNPGCTRSSCNEVECTLHDDSPPRRPPPKPQKIQLPPRTEMSHSKCNTSCAEGIVIDVSHTPRNPPSPTTYSIPSILNKSAVNSCNLNNSVEVAEEVFGMITLKANDVCYTSGTIEWVGRKRNFPLNSGFKVIKDNHILNDSNVKRMRKNEKDRTYTLETDDKQTECECADVLPTVHAIINHLDALHEAVDIVDIRLNNLESTVSSSHK